MTHLACDGVWVERNGRALLRDVKLEVEAGQLVALVGPNGSGKTTLLRAALGLQAPTRGLVTLDRENVAHLTPRERAARIAWLPQIPVNNEPIAVHEAVATGRYRFGESATQSRAAALAALTRLDASHLADRSVTALSGGERQRVALATLLAQQSPLLLLDEPANHLDPSQQVETYGLIGRLWQDGFGALLVTHDVNLLAALPCHDRVRIVGLRAGALALESRLDSPSLPDDLSQLFGMQLRSFEHDGRRIIIPWPLGEESA